MKRLLSLVLALALIAISLPVPAAFAAQGTGRISGTVKAYGQQPLGAYTVQIRDLVNGRVMATAPSNEAGSFSFDRLIAGRYVIEVVSGTGIIGTSAPVTLMPGTMNADGVGVLANAGTAIPEHRSFFSTTAGVVTIAAVGAGVVGIAVATGKKGQSPAR